MNMVTMTGYNHKIRVLLEKVIDKITNFKVEPDRFFVIKELFIKQYQNFKFQQPYEQALYYCSLILREHAWSWKDELEVLPNLEVDDLVKFYPLLLSRTFLECYIAGNIDSKEAVSMIQHIEDAFYKGAQPLSRALFASEHPSSRIIKLEESKNYFYATEGLNTSDENSALVHYIQRKVNALIDIKLEKFKNLSEETNFFWWEISGGTLRFDRIENEVAALKLITKTDLVDFFNEYVNVGAPKRKSLSLQVFGSSHSSEFKAEKVDPVEPNVVQIEDIFSFRRSRPLYPSFRGDISRLKAHDAEHQ